MGTVDIVLGGLGGAMLGALAGVYGARWSAHHEDAQLSKRAAADLEMAVDKAAEDISAYIIWAVSGRQGDRPAIPPEVVRKFAQQVNKCLPDIQDPVIRERAQDFVTRLQTFIRWRAQRHAVLKQRALDGFDSWRVDEDRLALNIQGWAYVDGEFLKSAIQNYRTGRGAGLYKSPNEWLYDAPVSPQSEPFEKEAWPMTPMMPRFVPNEEGGFVADWSSEDDPDYPVSSG